MPKKKRDKKDNKAKGRGKKDQEDHQNDQEERNADAGPVSSRTASSPIRANQCGF
jgi:hypothetical protein